MATYAELRNIPQSADGNDLLKKIDVATSVKATAMIDAVSPTATQLTWASEALDNPRSKAIGLMNYVIAKNKGLAVGLITGAPDNDIQTAIDAAVDALVA